MKKYLLIFLCIFVVSYPANSQGSLPEEMNISVAEWERQTGKTAADFIDLLEHLQLFGHLLFVSWIDELLDRNDSAIDHRLVQLLPQNRWLAPLNDDISRWIETLIRREFADDEDVIAMFEEEPWNYHFVSYLNLETYANLVKQTSINMVNNKRNLRVAVEHTFAHFLILDFKKQLGLTINPRVIYMDNNNINNDENSRL